MRTWFESLNVLSKHIGQRVLLIIPGTPNLFPLAFIFDAFYRRLRPLVSQLDVMVAVGHETPWSEYQICHALGISEAERSRLFLQMRFFNHEADRAERLMPLGLISAEEIEYITQGLIKQSLIININTRVADYDLLICINSVAPHELYGLSGGYECVLPGLSGSHFTAFLSNLGLNYPASAILGTRDHSIGRLLLSAARMIPVPCYILQVFMTPEARIGGLRLVTNPDELNSPNTGCWLPVCLHKQLYKTVIAEIPSAFHYLWQATSFISSLHSIVEPGGQLILYSPYISGLSSCYEDELIRIGYHTRPYLLRSRQPEDRPEVLLHAARISGEGKITEYCEIPDINIGLATAIPREMCETINLHYFDQQVISGFLTSAERHTDVLVLRSPGITIHHVQL